MNRRQRLRRRQIRTAGLFGPVGLVALVGVVGLLLPALHREEVRTLLPASARTVWAILNDLDGMLDWRRDLRRLERLPDAEGRVRWLEVRSGGGLTTYQRVESVAPSRMVVQSAETGRRWVYEVRGLDRGSELAVLQERTITNPFERTLVRVFGSDRNGIERLTTDLERRLAGRRAQLATRVPD